MDNERLFAADWVSVNRSVREAVAVRFVDDGDDADRLVDVERPHSGGDGVVSTLGHTVPGLTRNPLRRLMPHLNTSAAANAHTSSP